MRLTAKNYFGQEAAMQFMSVSQFKSFEKCQAAALAEIRGEYVRPETTALLVGSYVDARLEGKRAFEQFVSEHPQMFKKDGNLKAEFVQAEQIYQRIKSDQLLSMLLNGRKQVVVKGVIAGVPFRGKIDSLLNERICQKIMAKFPRTVEVLGGPFTVGAIVDGKIMRDFAPIWSDAAGHKVSWVDSWGYALQGAVYRELWRQRSGKTLPFILGAATKEDEADLDALYVPPEELDACLRIVEDNAPIYQEIKLGKREPIRCECCAYCRSTKKLTAIRNYKEV